MIFASAVGLVLTLCMVAAYLWLIRRLFQVKAALPVLKLKDGLGRLKGTRTRLAVLGALFFLAWFGSQFSVKVWSPDMLMVFNYEEAARGQNPNVTRFNESGILAEPILEEVIQRGGTGRPSYHLHSVGCGEAGRRAGVFTENLYGILDSLFRAGCAISHPAKNGSESLS